MSSAAGVDEETRPRKISQSSRFEIEKVEEMDLSPGGGGGGGGGGGDLSSVVVQSPSSSSQLNNKSVLKKTVKHFEHDDDDFFDLNTYPNSREDGKDQQSKRLLESSGQQQQQQQAKSGTGDENDDESGNGAGGCFQMIYNEKNQPVSILVNLQSKETSSYKNCVYDLKTVALYQKLIAEFVGTMLLTLYACSIGLAD